MREVIAKIKKILIVYLTAFLFLWGNVGYTYGFPTPPSAPEAPTAPTYVPEAPSAPEAPTAPEKPSAPTAPTYEGRNKDSSDSESSESNVSNTGSETTTQNSTNTTSENSSTNTSSTNSGDTSDNQNSSSGGVSPTTSTIQSTGGQEGNETMGSVSISTGNADSTGLIVNTGVENILTASQEGYSGGIVITSIGNGPDSVNSGSVVVTGDSVTSQINVTNVTNNMNMVSDSGGNEASKNMGDAKITTGDANTSGTIVNAVNTNIDGIMISEFNVLDDHVGDIILDFASGCISGCTNGEGIKIVNSGNGSRSTNNSQLELNTNDITFQQNDANVENNMILAANTGKNTADKNMGMAEIQTGNANVQASIVNFVNNNIAGDVVYAVVNIFGNLVGDIIMPLEMLSACCEKSDITLANTGNGPESTNTLAVNLSDSDLINQFNNASVENNLLFEATTGDNGLSKDMGGDSTIKTGDAEVVTRLLNVVNTNIVGGNAWLVIVNEAGKWIGKILGGNGSSFAGSPGFEFIVNDAGDILAVNSDNGAGSENKISANVESNESFTQVNNANVVNNVTLSANTGGNQADKNMGGASIVTGDAKIVANIVNFVNNNIIGSGRLFVTVVNVFGSWIGDFITPGHEKDKDTPADQVGGGGELPPSSDTSYSDNQSVGSSPAGSSGSSGSSSGVSSDLVSGTVLSNAVSSYKKAFISGLKKGVIASGVSDEASQEEGGGVLTGEAGKKALKINLAYGLFVLPLLFAILLLRRRYLLRHAKAK